VTGRVAVLAAAELPPGARAKVEAFGTEVAVFNVDGELFAVANACPHHGGPLCHGRISGTRLPAGQYEHRWGRENRVLVCPWHGWEFDLETGRALFDPAVGVRTFDVEVEDGRVVLARRAQAR
jgi:nitrite reductase/ring-hydroxylating ferredoxin subunit